MTPPKAVPLAALVAGALLLAGCTASAAPTPGRPAITIVPAPAALHVDSSAPPVELGAGSRILVSGEGAHAVAETVASALRAATGLPLPIVEAAPEQAGDGDLVFAVIGGGTPMRAELGTIVGADETHDIAAGDGRIALTAASAAGLFRATQSLRQLLPARPSGASIHVPAFSLHDAPRFAYRAASLDVARHFFTVDQVIGYLDAIALLKLDVLHLHLTDDQGWRIAIDGYPALTEVGAATAVDGAPGGFYTQDDYRRIVAAAHERFIEIVPEVDLPGHTNAALASVPELNCDGTAPAPYTGIEVGFSSLCASPERAEATAAFLMAVLGQLAALTPGPWLHVGGDESLSTSETDYLDLVGRITTIGAATGKTLIGYHEMGASRQLPPGTVGQYWSYTTPQDDSAALTKSFIEQGGTVILAPADVAYLDMMYPDDPPGPLGHSLGLKWADGPTTLEEAYSWEPAAVVPGLAETSILGIEAMLWTETASDMSEVEFLAFPRIAAIAELAWSPAPGAGGRDLDDFHARLAPLGAIWTSLGIAYHRVGGVDWTGAGEWASIG